MSIGSIASALTGGLVHPSSPGAGSGAAAAAAAGASTASGASAALGGSADGSVGLFDGVLKHAAINGVIGAVAPMILKFLPGGPLIGGIMGALGGAALQMFSNYRKIKKIHDTNAALLGAAGVQPATQAELQQLLAGNDALLQGKVGQLSGAGATAATTAGVGGTGAAATVSTDPFARVPTAVSDTGGAYLQNAQDTSWIRTTDGTTPAGGGSAQFAPPIVTVVDGITQPAATQPARNPVVPVQGADAAPASLAASGGGPSASTTEKHVTVRQAALRAQQQARLRTLAAATKRDDADAAASDRKRVDDQAFARALARRRARMHA